jgi:hypothetical protein
VHGLANGCGSGIGTIVGRLGQCPPTLTVQLDPSGCDRPQREGVVAARLPNPSEAAATESAPSVLSEARERHRCRCGGTPTFSASRSLSGTRTAQEGTGRGRRRIAHPNARPDGHSRSGSRFAARNRRELHDRDLCATKRRCHADRRAEVDLPDDGVFVWIAGRVDAERGWSSQTRSGLSRCCGRNRRDADGRVM